MMTEASLQTRFLILDCVVRPEHLRSLARQRRTCPAARKGRAMCAGSDIITIRRALETYEDIDVNFAGSRESELLKVLFWQDVRNKHATAPSHNCQCPSVFTWLSSHTSFGSIMSCIIYGECSSGRIIRASTKSLTLFRAMPGPDQRSGGGRGPEVCGHTGRVRQPVAAGRLENEPAAAREEAA